MGAETNLQKTRATKKSVAFLVTKTFRYLKWRVSWTLCLAILGAFSVKALSMQLLCEDSSILENDWNKFQKLFSQMVVKNGDQFHGIPIRKEKKHDKQIQVLPEHLIMAGQPTPHATLWSGLINHWFPLIRPAIKLLFVSGIWLPPRDDMTCLGSGIPINLLLPLLVGGGPHLGYVKLDLTSPFRGLK